MSGYSPLHIELPSRKSTFLSFSHRRANYLIALALAWSSVAMRIVLSGANFTLRGRGAWLPLAALARVSRNLSEELARQSKSGDTH